MLLSYSNTFTVLHHTFKLGIHPTVCPVTEHTKFGTYVPIHHIYEVSGVVEHLIKVCVRNSVDSNVVLRYRSLGILDSSFPRWERSVDLGTTPNYPTPIITLFHRLVSPIRLVPHMQ
jgi:hypothetical protein